MAVLKNEWIFFLYILKFYELVYIHNNKRRNVIKDTFNFTSDSWYKIAWVQGVQHWSALLSLWYHAFAGWTSQSPWVTRMLRDHRAADCCLCILEMDHGGIWVESHIGWGCLTLLFSPAPCFSNSEIFIL